jgi:osmotically-inducible protein OsmY
MDFFTQKVTDLVATEPFDENHARVIPLVSVQTTFGEEIRLTIASTQLSHFPQYHEKDFVGPSTQLAITNQYRRDEILNWFPFRGIYESGAEIVPLLFHPVSPGVTASRQMIGRPAPVHYAQGILGRINHLWVDQYSDKVTHLLVQRGYTPYYLVIPWSMVEMVDDDGVHTRCTEAQIQELCWYRRRSEADILVELYDRLTNAPYDFGAVTASLENGIVCLRGMVGTAYTRYQAAEIARAIEGVVDVEVLLVTDADVVSRIVGALSVDPRTAAAPIEVTCYGGLVILRVLVENGTIRAAAEEIAANQLGVQSLTLALEMLEDQEA